MTQKHQIQLFEEKKVRTVWDDQEEKCYFSIVDVCAVLAESKDPQAYWLKLKQRLKDEGNATKSKMTQKSKIIWQYQSKNVLLQRD